MIDVYDLNCSNICSSVGSCPFSGTDESELAQNYGCLPAPMEIVHLRQVHGKTWACHSDESKPCVGAIKWQQRNGLNGKVIDDELITLNSDWVTLVKGAKTQY